MNCAALVRSSLATALMLLAGIANAADFVNLVATRPAATEGTLSPAVAGSSGIFTLTRSDATSNLTVLLRVSGSAMPGNANSPVTGLNPADYTLSIGASTPALILGTANVPSILPVMTYVTRSLQVDFLPGERAKQINVKAVADALNEGAESVILTISPDPSYITGTFATATVTINDANLTASMSMPDGNATEFVGDPSPSGFIRVQFNDPAAWFNRTLVMENPSIDIPGVVAAGANRNLATVNVDYDFTYMYRHSPDGGQLAFQSSRVALSGTGNAEYQIVGATLPNGLTIYSGFPILNFPYPVTNAGVARIQVTSGGQGYSAIPDVTLSGTGGPGGTDPGHATAVVIDGKVVGIDIDTSSSTNWHTVPTVSIAPAVGQTGNGAQASVIMDRGLGQQAQVAGVINGGVYAITFTHTGILFANFSSAPTVTFSSIDGGSGVSIDLAAAIAADPSVLSTINAQQPLYLTSSGSVFTTHAGAIATSNSGSGYVIPPAAAWSGGGATGWQVAATIQGKLVAGEVMNAGIGYTGNTVTLDTSANDGSSIVGSPVLGALSLPQVTLEQNQGRTIAERRSSGVQTITPWRVDSSSLIPAFATQALLATGFDLGKLNKAGSEYVQYTRGGPGDIVIGDVISIGTDAQRYQVRAINHYLITLDQPLATDLGNATAIHNAIPTVMVQDRQDAPIPYDNLVQYGAMEYAVYPRDDTEPEAAERVISRVYSSADFTIADPTELTMYIADDDSVANIQLVSNASEGSVEGKALVTISQPLPVDIDIPYLVGGTADSDTYEVNGTIDPLTGLNPEADYNALPGYVTIKAGQTSAQILVTPKSDNRPETGGESVIITLLPTLDVVMSGTQSSGVYPSATVNIANALGEVSIVKTQDGYESSTAPGDGNFQFTAATDPANGLPGGADINVVFQLSGTATYGSPDFLLTGSSGSIVTFDPASKTGSVIVKWGTTSYVPSNVLVKVVDDLEVEGNENVVLTIIDGTGYRIDSQHASDTVIIEDDEPVISIARIRDASEPNIPGQFKISYPGVPAATPQTLMRSITVPYVVTGTATAGTDYATLSGTITIPSGSKSIVLNVIPSPDDLVESAETVIVTLQPGTGYTLDADSATLNIADNKTVGIVAGRHLNEAGLVSGQFTASFTGPVLAGPLTVTYKIDMAASTAVAGTDFDATGYILSGTDYVGTAVIPAGSNSVVIDVPALNDSIIDPGKTVVIDLVDTTSYAVDPANQIVTLLCDDDEPTPTFTAVRDSSEGGASGIIRISVASNPHPVAYTIPIRFSGTATVGTDYTIDDGTNTGSAADFIATIPINQSIVNVHINAIDDSLAEGTETVTAALLIGVTPQNTVPGSFATINLLDNEPSVSIAATTDAEEPAVQGIFTITRTGATTAALTVHYAVGAGTATVGSDYVDISGTGTVTIPIGQTTITIPVTPIDDNIVEGTETIIVNLATDPAYQITTGSATMNLLDNEPTVSIAVANRNLNEPTDATTLTISSTGAITAPLIVPIHVSGTATEGVDYSSIPASVTLTAAAPSATIAFHVIDDFTVEGTETATFAITGGGIGTTYAVGTRSVTVNITDDAVDATIDPNGPPPGSVLNEGNNSSCGAGSGLAALIGGLLALVFVGRSRRR